MMYPTSDNSYQLNNLAQYNYDTSSPYYQMVKQYSDESRAMSDAHTARLMALQQQRMAQAQQQARATAVQQTLVPMQNAYTYDYYTPSTDVSTMAVTPEAPGFWGQVEKRAIPQTLGTIQGGLGALADVVGADDARDWLLNKAAANYNFAETNAPRLVPGVENIESFNDAGTWAMETLADFVPTLLGTAVSGGGSLVAGGVAAGARGLGAASVKNITAKKIAEYTAKGMTKDMAEKAAQKYVNRSVMTGVLGFTGLQETGSAYNQNIQTHGVEGASSGRALLTGAASAAVMGILGAEIPIVRMLTGTPASAAVEQGVARAISSGLARGAFREGGEEATQEVIQTINAMVSDGRTNITEQDFLNVLNSFAGGALLGAPMGAVTSLNNRKGNQQSPSATPTSFNETVNNSLGDTPFTTPQQRAQQGFDLTVQNRDKALLALEAEEQATTQQYQQLIDSNRQQLFALGEAMPTPEAIQMDPKKRKAAYEKAQRQYFESIASLEYYKADATKRKEEVLKQADETSRKIGRELVTDNTVAQANQFYSDPDAFSAMSDMSVDALSTAQQYQGKLKERSAYLREQSIPDIENRLRQANVVEDNRKAATLRKELLAAKKDLAQVERAGKVLNDASMRIEKMMSKPDKDFSPAKLDAQISRINNVDMPTDMKNVDTLIDNTTYALYEGATNILEQDREAVTQRTADNLARLQEQQAVQQQYQQGYDALGGSDMMQGIAQQQLALPQGVTQQALPQGTGIVLPQQVAQVPKQQALFDSSPDNFYNQRITNTLSMNPLTTPTPFTNTTDQFLQQTPQTIPGGVAFPSTPDAMLQQTPSTTESLPVSQGAPFDRSIDTFLKNLPKDDIAWQSSTGINAGNTPIANKIYNLIQSSLKQLPGLGRVVTVVDSVSSLNNPNIDPYSLGAYDAVTQRVYLFADAIELATQMKKNKDKVTSKELKDTAVRTLVHEGIGHYGLSVLLNQSQRESFLRSLDKSFKDHPLYKEVKQQYTPVYYQDIKRGTPPLIIAEEFLARLAESNTINQLLGEGKSYFEGTPAHKSWLEKAVGLFKRVLQKIGFSNVTRDDVQDVFKAIAATLSQDTTSTIISSPVVKGGVVSSLPEGNPFPSNGGLDSNIGPNERRLIAEQQGPGLLDRARNIDTSSAKEKFIEQFVDAKRPLERLVNEVEARTGVLTSTNNIFTVQQGMSNAMANEMKAFAATHVDNILNSIVEMTPKGTDLMLTFAQVADYMTAQAAIERNARLGPDKVSGKGLSTPEAMQIVQRLGSPEMTKISDQIQSMNKARMATIKQNKLVRDDKADAWIASGDLYMPLKSWGEIQEKDNPSWYSSPARKSLSIPTRQKKMSHRATGSDKEIDNAIVHAILQSYDVIAMKHNVVTGRSLLQLIEDNPTFTDLFEIDSVYVPAPGEQHATRTSIAEDGSVKEKKIKFTSELYPGQTVRLLDNHANPVTVILKPEGLATAFKGENIAQLSKPMQALSNLRKNLSKLFTVYSPLFWLRNPVRDLMTAVVNYLSVANDLGAQGAPNARNMMKALVSKGFMTMLSTKGMRAAIQHAVYTDGNLDPKFMQKFEGTYVGEYMQYWDDFTQFGAKSSYYSSGGYDQVHMNLQKDLENKRPATTWQAVRSRMANIGKHMEAISDALENQTRFVAFVEMVKAFEAAGKQPLEARRLAANKAQNLTVNFTRKGAMAPAMDALYMFASANIAGNTRLLETILRRNKETGKLDKAFMAKFLTLPMAAYAAQAMLAREMMPEDDDGINEYDKIPDYVKDNNIILPIIGSDGKYITIPVAYGLNVFWTMARNMADSIYSEAAGTVGPSFTDAATKSILASFDNFSPVGGMSNEGLTTFVPTIFRPFAQLATNKSFAGHPIMPESTHLVRGELPDSQKAWSTTGPVYKAFAEGLNELFGGSTTRSGAIDISPETIEHLMGAYTGGIGRIFSSMANTLVKVQQGTLTNNDIATMPPMSVFVRGPQDSDTNAIFTRARMELQTQLNTAEAARENLSLSREEKLAIVRENQAGVQAKSTLNRTQKQLNNIRSKEKSIQSNPRITQDTKNKQLEQLQKRKVAIMKAFVKKSMELGIGVN